MRVRCDKAGISKATRIIKDGGIVVFPTDTVYGIGCNPYISESVDKIYKIKSRDKTKPLPLLVHSIKVAKEIASFDDITIKLAEKFWPGALTILAKITDKTLQKSLGLQDMVAIRVPDNRCVLELLEQVNCIIGTSANISGEESFTDPQKCSVKLDFDVFIDGGPIYGKGESTIIQVINGNIKIHRHGAISKEELSV